MDWDQLEASSANLVDRVRAPAASNAMHLPTLQLTVEQRLSQSLYLLTHLQDEVGMPRIDRNLDQVQQMSEMMVARIRHRDSTADGLASARLLAQQGLNQRQYAVWHVKSSCSLTSCQGLPAQASVFAGLQKH